MQTSKQISSEEVGRLKALTGFVAVELIAFSAEARMVIALDLMNLLKFDLIRAQKQREMERRKVEMSKSKSTGKKLNVAEEKEIQSR